MAVFGHSGPVGIDCIVEGIGTHAQLNWQTAKGEKTSLLCFCNVNSKMSQMNRIILTRCRLRPDLAVHPEFGKGEKRFE